ncbi:MAG: hypothetical protein WBC88_02920, partial [Candidatus Zixiibacteriota bacterium]
STCEKCARKLALLRSMEGAAKKIEVEEPRQEYWDTFSSRVREKIVQREEVSLVFRLQKTLQAIFSFSPLKMKVAAGLVSVVLVFIVGKLYVDYRGQEIVPSREVIRSEEQPQLDVTKVTKKGEVSEAEDRDRTIRPLDEPKREAEFAEVKEAKKRAIVTEQPITGEGSTAEKMGIPAPPKVAEERGVPASAPAPTVQTLAEPEAPSKQLSEETEATGAGMKDEAKGKKAIDMPVPVKGVGKEEGVSENAEQERETREVRDILSTQHGFVARGSYMVNENMVPRMGEDDTLRQADELKRAIQIWRDYIKENPTDSLTDQGYLQVAMAYYLLAKLSRDTTVISEGKKLIETYFEQIDDPALKKKLSDRLEKIKALREK